MQEVKFLTKKTFATADNARTAVRKAFGDNFESSTLRFFIHVTEQGRFLPVFIGNDAVQANVHFTFSVVA